MSKSTLIGVIAAAIAALPFAEPARGEAAVDFFKDKQISLIIGYNPGGTYDLYSRVAATLLPRYIPGNPTIVPKNMPGVGSVKAANYLFGQAPKDGLTIGMVGQQLALTQALGSSAVAYDMRRFQWLGRLTPVVEATAVWHTSPTKTLADAMKRETVLAGTSAGATSDVMPTLMNRLAGTRFKIVFGYRGTTGALLAMERGETEGAHTTIESILISKADWLRDKKVAILVQYATERHEAFPNVPAMVEFGKTAEDKQILALFGSTADIGRSLMAPPGVPAERLEILRKAFSTMVADPAFKQEMMKRRMEIGPLSGEALQKRITQTLDITPAVAARAVELSKIKSKSESKPKSKSGVK
jgi:tripartite-type tricarboxylate transporter receptor subunit TctC